MTDADTFADILIAMGQRVASEESLRQSAEYNLQSTRDDLRRMTETNESQLKKIIELNRNMEDDKRVYQNDARKLSDYEQVKSQSIRQLKQIENLEKMLDESDRAKREFEMRTKSMEERISELIDKLDRFKKKAKKIIVKK